MRISSAFPSDYIRAVDLQGREVTVTIDRVELRELGDDTKPALSFKGAKKSLIFNKTNSSTIAEAYGDETETWSGKPLVLYPTTADYQGRRVDAIRVRVPARSDHQAPPPSQAQQQEAPPPQSSYDGHDMGDEIPF